MRLLLIDNHDSFSAILHHYLWIVGGERPLLFRNDELTRDALDDMAFDAVVLSPGPGHPASVRDFGICRDILELYPDMPILGVCLGMQGLAHFAGARIVPLEGALHGRPSWIAHDGTGVFRGIPDELTAIRYHSLRVDPDSLPSNIRVTARAVDDGCVMGLSFTDRPWHGVQFHPEAFATEYGQELLANFLDLAQPGRVNPGLTLATDRGARLGDTPRPTTTPPNSPLPVPSTMVAHVELPWRDPAVQFVRYFSNVTHSFWLDGPAWGATIMGRAERIHNFSEWAVWKQWIDSLALNHERTAPWTGYRGGPVGQLGYELYQETLIFDQAGVAPNVGQPLARWLLPDGYLVFDPTVQKVWAAYEGERPPSWLSEIIDAWDEAPRAPHPAAAHSVDVLPPLHAWQSRLREPEYVARVALIQDAIAAGETYEACLTHAFTVTTDRGEVDPLAVYLRLRLRNAAPYAAYFSFEGLDLLSSSPELFLESSEGLLHSHPIKGTRRRGADRDADRALRDDLATSPKDAAENRMIVDLTRHDLARVCEPGSVVVTKFLRVEEYPAVFQLVSDVQGRLTRAVTAPEAIAACFPGGSMTGAPKERTVEIVSSLEVEPRGAYSGAMGYLTGGGGFVLSMVIRTIEHTSTPGGDLWRVGCGGAVLADSDAASEWREATLKARSVIDAVSQDRAG
jgi:para-aminobenzoate synthetase